MKKRLWIIIAVILAVLLIPIPSGAQKDGGTREYTALTYKVVDWNRIIGNGVYDETKVYFFPDNFKSLSSLWDKEEQEVLEHFKATVVELNGNSVLVEPLEGEGELRSSDQISFDIANLEQIGVQAGSVVEIAYDGLIMESYPAQIHAASWKMVTDLRSMEYTEQWIDKQTAEPQQYNIFSDIIITKIYSNCFFATTVIPMPYEIKLNGELSDKWCVGDQVICTYEDTYYDEQTRRVEADMLTIDTSTFRIDPNACYKPVIYLYPEEETRVSVKLTLDGKLTCAYPAYGDGWNVTAMPDGTLADVNGQTYNYLYWEGETDAQWDMTQGFCVKGEETAAFLEEALEKLGLTRREANEFIVYWLPLMQENPYNIISFQTDVYVDAAKLEVTPVPDTVIRVFMTWQAAYAYRDVPEQTLTAPERTGFTVVEWGGTEITE